MEIKGIKLGWRASKVERRWPEGRSEAVKEDSGDDKRIVVDS